MFNNYIKGEQTDFYLSEKSEFLSKRKKNYLSEKSEFLSQRKKKLSKRKK